MRLWQLLGAFGAIWFIAYVASIALSRAGNFDPLTFVANVRTTPMWFVVGFCALRRRDGIVAAFVLAVADAVAAEVDSRLGLTLQRSGQPPASITTLSFAGAVVASFLARALAASYLGTVFRRAWYLRFRGFARSAPND